MIVKRKVVNLSIDPGLGGTGVIAWPAYPWECTIKYLNTKLFLVKNASWEYCARNIAIQVKEWCDFNQYKAHKIYIEFPRAFQSAIGMAATNRGDILKLAYLIGCIGGVFSLSDITLIPVHVWKGQLSKEQTERRCKSIIKKEQWVKSNHLWDAIGIALYTKGLF